MSIGGRPVGTCSRGAAASASTGKSCGILRDRGRTSAVQQLKCGSAIGRTEVSCTGRFRSARGILWQKVCVNYFNYL